jgi:hypothetical protein
MQARICIVEAEMAQKLSVFFLLDVIVTQMFIMVSAIKSFVNSVNTTKNNFIDLGFRVTGGKRLSNGDLGAFVTAVNHNKAYDTLGEIKEGKNIQNCINIC